MLLPLTANWHTLCGPAFVFGCCALLQPKAVLLFRNLRRVFIVAFRTPTLFIRALFFAAMIFFVVLSVRPDAMVGNSLLTTSRVHRP